MFGRVQREPRDLPRECKVGDARRFVFHDPIQLRVPRREQRHPAFGNSLRVGGVQLQQRRLVFLDFKARPIFRKLIGRKVRIAHVFALHIERHGAPVRRVEAEASCALAKDVDLRRLRGVHRRLLRAEARLPRHNGAPFPLARFRLHRQHATQVPLLAAGMFPPLFADEEQKVARLQARVHPGQV